VTGSRQRQADAPLVSLDRGALDEARFFEAGDELGHPRNGDPFKCRELSHPDTRVLLDLDEKRDLPARDAEGVDLASQLAGELQEHRAQPVGEDCGIGGDCDGHFVNQVNESA
jgi:hypothetical protein